MRTLYLLRHGHAAQDAPAGQDSQRALTEQGRLGAASQGRFLRLAGLALQGVIASPALRARQTAEALVSAAGLSLAIELSDALYNGSGSSMLDFVRGLEDSRDPLLLVSHMPAIGELVALLTTEHVDLAARFSPATLCAVAMEVNQWSQCDFGTGELVLLLPPLLPPH